MHQTTDQAAVVAEVLVGAVTRRMRQAGQSWAPGHLLAHGLLTDLLATGAEINRDFLRHVADHVAAGLPENVSAPRQDAPHGPRYSTVLLADTQDSGTTLVAVLRLSKESTLVVSRPDQLRGAVLHADVEVIDRTVGMNAARRQAIDEQLEICKATSRR